MSGEKVGEKEANKSYQTATSRGTDIAHTREYYLKNSELPSVQPLSEMLFKQSKPTLDKIDNIHAQEQSLFSYQLGVAGSVDCIAEYEGELAIIDFKTVRNRNPRSGLTITSSSVRIRMYVV